MNRNIGIATAYGYALSKGYTGTEEEFAELMAELPEFAAEAETSAQAAADAAGAAAQSESNAEAWAVGERDGEPVTIGDDTFNNNAKHYSQEALAYRGAAYMQTLRCEAWTVGQIDGEDVPQSDPTYHNNAKYYADSAGETVSAFTETTVLAAVQAVNTAGQTQIGAVNTAGQTALTAVGEARTAAVNAVQQKGEDVLDELQDYADLPEDVADLKSAINNLSEDVISAKNLFHSDLIKNRRYTNSGTISTGTNVNYVASDYIYLDANAVHRNLHISGLSDSVTWKVLIYSASDKSFIGKKTISTIINLEDFSSPIYIIVASDSAFSAETAMNDYVDNAQIMLSVTADEPYEPWKTTYIENDKIQKATSVMDSDLPVTARAVNDIVHNLPDYYKTEIDSVIQKVLNYAELDSLVFGIYTDIHFTANDPYHAIKNEEIRALREIADNCILDFTLDGGDLLTHDTLSYSISTINRTQAMFSDCRAEHLEALGDHDLNQTDTLLTGNGWAKLTHPYMRNIVYSAALPNCYYLDFPNKKTRFICINSGGDLSGLEPINANTLYAWLLNEVFTDDVKNDWKFVVFSHGPIDYDWAIGMKHRASTSTVQKWKFLALNDLFEAINSAVPFDSARTQETRDFYYDAQGILVQPTESYVETLSCLIRGSINSFTRDFSGWTSKVRLVVSGHVHCDRLNALTNGVPTSYGIAYTGSASPTGYKGADDYYIPVFGTDGVIAEWQDIYDREIGTIKEALMDIYVVNSNSIYKIRFGAGNDMNLAI